MPKLKKSRHLPPYLINEILKSVIDGIHTVTSASIYYGVSRQTIYTWLTNRGVVYPKIKLGRPTKKEFIGILKDKSALTSQEYLQIREKESGI